MLRIHRTNQWEGKAVAYKIIIDGEAVGKVKNGGTFDVEVSPGKHQVVASVIGFKSEPMTFDYTGGILEIECSTTVAFPNVPHLTIRSSKHEEPSDLYKDEDTGINWLAWGALVFLLAATYGYIFGDNTAPSEVGTSTVQDDSDSNSSSENTTSRTETLGPVEFALYCDGNQDSYRIIAIDKSLSHGIIVYYNSGSRGAGSTGVNPEFSHVDVSVQVSDWKYDLKTFYPPNREYTYLVFDGPFYLTRSNPQFVDETYKDDYGVVDTHNCREVSKDRADEAIRDFWIAHEEREESKRRERQRELDSRDI